MDQDVSTREIARLDYSAYLQESNDRLRFQTEFSHSALKSLTLVNGGGILALLTFIGNSNATFDPNPIWWAFASFAVGLTFTLAAHIGAYFSQAAFMNVTLHQMWDAQRAMLGEPPKQEYHSDFRAGNKILYSAIGCALASMAGFIAGAAFSLAGLL